MESEDEYGGSEVELQGVFVGKLNWRTKWKRESEFIDPLLL